jgi:hypothetical protein
MKRTAKATGIAIGLLSLPTKAAACGECVFGMFEYALPYTMAWCLGIAIWFWIVMTIKDWYRFFTAVLWIVAAFFIGSAFCGPLPFSLLGVTAFAATCKMFRSETWKQLSKAQQIGLKAVSVAAIFCAAAGLTVSMQSKATRSDADFVLQWGGGHQSNIILRNLVAQKDTLQLRRILAETKDEYLAEKVAEALAVVDREKDEPAPNTQYDLPEQQTEHP